MRERLLAAFVALALLTALVYGFPRALVRAGVVQDEAQRDVQRSAQAVSEVIAARLQAGLPAAGSGLAFLRSGDQVLYRTPERAEPLAGPAVEQGDAAERLVAVSDVGGGGVVEVSRARSVVRRDVARALQPIVLTGLLAVGLAVLAAILLSSRLARPFQLLAAQASALGDGDVQVRIPVQRVREAEAIAAALRASSARVVTMLQRERAFARNASHQLRTPLTGMRLRVEDVAAWPETPDSVRAELSEVLTEVDRLSETVTSLLAFAREERMADWQPERVDDLVSGVTARWHPLAARDGRRVRGDVTTPAEVSLPRVAVEQVLDVLVDNALKHGAGTVLVSGCADERAVRFSVSDEGRGLPPGQERELFRRREGAGSRPDSEGIGLALCAELAQAMGGRLVLAGRTPTTFELLLPRATTGDARPSGL